MTSALVWLLHLSADFEWIQILTTKKVRKREIEDTNIVPRKKIDLQHFYCFHLSIYQSIIIDLKFTNILIKEPPVYRFYFVIVCMFFVCFWWNKEKAKRLCECELVLWVSEIFYEKNTTIHSTHHHHTTIFDLELV